MTAPDTLPPELAELGELLREEPPRPDPAWARRLDSRAAAGFPRPPRRSPWAILKAHRRALIPVVSFACVALLVVGLPIVGVSSDDDSGGGGSGSGGGGESASTSADEGAPPRPARLRGTAIPPQDSAGGAPEDGPGPGGRRRVGSDGRRTRAQERSAALTLAARPRRIEEVAAGILRVTDAAGGFVASSSVSGGSGSGGTFELRIPVARLDKAVADLSRLAKVRERTQSSRDITAQTVSARERLREARREREGLLRALAQRDHAQRDGGRQGAPARRQPPDRDRARLAAPRGQPRHLRQRLRPARVRAGGGRAGPDDGRWTPGDALPTRGGCSRWPRAWR